MKLFKKISFLDKRKLVMKSDGKKDFIAEIYELKGEAPCIELNFIFKNLDDKFNNYNVIFEYYYAGLTKRHNLGSVLKNRENIKKIPVTEITPDLVLCNLKIVNPENGKIEGFKNRFRPDILSEQDEDQSNSNEKFNTTSWITWRQADIESPWKVSIQPNQRPVCYLSKKMQLKKNLYNDDLHKSLVLSSIFRDVLIKYTAASDIGEDDKWRKKIIDIAELLLEPFPSDGDDDVRDNWIEEVTEKFAKKHKFAEKHNDIVKS